MIQQAFPGQGCVDHGRQRVLNDGADAGGAAGAWRREPAKEETELECVNRYRALLRERPRW